MRYEYEIIVFSDDWNGLPFSCKHLLSKFLPEIPMVWVETIGLRAPKLNLYDLGRSFKKISGWLSSRPNGNSFFPDNLCVLDPFQIPYNHHKLIRKINKVTMLHSLKKFRKKSSLNRVVITTWPFLGNLVGHLGENLSIYYRVDDFSEFPGVKRERMCQLEKELIDKVDMVVASAENLARLKDNGKVVKYLPHGVDYQHFRNGLKTTGRQARLQNIQSPRIGFFGLLNSWIDFDLIYRVAKGQPEWSFVFIGPSQLSSSLLSHLPNIHFLGPVAYDELPSYANHFDVAVIPFKINKLTISVNPLKLMEYFSLGLPVVSTPLPEVKKYADHVFIASEPGAFSNSIYNALKENEPNNRLKRQKIAESQSWTNKARELKRWIDEALSSKIEERKY